MKTDQARATSTGNGASAVIFDDQGRVLLQKRRDFRVWALPGGGIEPGETSEQAAIREVREETGYDAAIDRWIGEYRRPQLSDGRGRVYRGHATGGAPIQEGPETRDVGWFSLDALPRSLPSWHRIAIQDALAPDGDPVVRDLRLSPLEVAVVRLAHWLRRAWHALR